MLSEIESDAFRDSGQERGAIRFRRGLNTVLGLPQVPIQSANRHFSLRLITLSVGLRMAKGAISGTMSVCMR